MALPKRKISKSRRDKRRTHQKLATPILTVCQDCGASKPMHQVCEECGKYKGREVIEPKTE
jgi:large subunit ribosomal protein L32